MQRFREVKQGDLFLEACIPIIYLADGAQDSGSPACSHDFRAVRMLRQVRPRHR